jgi:lysophospholipase L1-like esterase
MKKILSLVIGLLMLFSVVGCGTTTESSQQPEEDPNAYLAELFHGIYALEERDGTLGEPKIGGGAFVPMRFSHEMIKAYEKYNKTARVLAPYYNCTAGVRMDFYTDAETISFHYNCTDGFNDNKPGYAVDTLNVFENGEYQTSFDVVKDKPDDLIYKRKSGEAESRITIVFPMYHGLALSNFKLGNTRPVTEYDHRILYFGDSITQGLYADRPCDMYAHQVSVSLNADYMNLAVGGEIFREKALEPEICFDPTHIVVALGTNDYYSGLSARNIKINAFNYLEAVKKKFPGVPITVISNFDAVPDEFHEAIAEAAKASECYFVNGSTLISAAVKNWNKDAVHPSSIGFAEITRALTPILQEQLK